MQAVGYTEAIEKGFIVHEKRRRDEVMAIVEEPKAVMYGLRFPERDAKTDADYMRISYKEEDDEWRANQKRMTLTEKEQKKLPREILTDNWEEDMSLYKHKRKP